ncbi:MAG TPA: RuvX/YqgF family protein [Fervidobacterium sp.]|nr:Holliday junction resolvase RuvX [Fervidobacterium sp.]HOS52691.1 RuvX/YqgF family protein [Fervidobacterium sp.]HOV53680.1 RuvX/YqgF family protein [Fervidobacterium sp.]
MSIIAIDYGKSKCGYAIGTMFVSESGTVKTSDIQKKMEKFREIVLGLPLSMSGNYSTQTFEVIKFGLSLLKAGKRVLFIDERMTTKMAKVYDKKDDDRFSAEQLLLDYLQAPDRTIELKTSVASKPQEISCECAAIVNVPCDKDFHISKIIGYSEDPYIAYTMFKEGGFVYRVWNDFVQNLTLLEKLPDCVIIDNSMRNKLSELSDAGNWQNIKIIGLDIK